MKNIQASDFIDKCTARFHFERHGVQLYQIVLAKCPEQLRPRFEKILKQEQEHALLLEEVLDRHGANPYALTHSAKVTDIETQGIIRSAKKSGFRDLMDILLTAELVDTANWELLMLLAEKVGDQTAKTDFQRALAEEVDHLRFIRQHILKDLLGRKVA